VKRIRQVEAQNPSTSWTGAAQESHDSASAAPVEPFGRLKPGMLATLAYHLDPP